MTKRKFKTENKELNEISVARKCKGPSTFKKNDIVYL